MGLLEDSAGATSGVVKTRNPGETRRIGARIGQVLRPGDVLGLVGELGAGKTCLVQGIAEGLGVPPSYIVTSPTFTLINDYPGRLPLAHVDVYRLGGIADLEEMGLEEYFAGKGVVVVEWAEKIRGVLPVETVWICVHRESETERRIAVSGLDHAAGRIAAAMKGRGAKPWR